MPEQVVSASEIGEYEFCARSWWLAHVLHLPRGNQEQLALGRTRHRQHGQVLRRANTLQWVALVIVLAVAIAALLLLLTAGMR